MASGYNYTLELKWLGDENGVHHRDDRLYQITIEGKELLKGSADKPFFGNPSLYNPEDLLLSSLSACHMMSYLYLCRKEGITVISYQDNPVGILKLNQEGRGRFETVTLKPEVTLLDLSFSQKALKLHEKAGEFCFIANSVNFDIVHNVTIK